MTDPMPTSVTGITAAKMQEIADSTVVSGAVDGNSHLILTTHGGTEIDAGDVQGDQGVPGPTMDISALADIGTDLTDDELVAVRDTTNIDNSKSAVSRFWTYISSKITGSAKSILTTQLTADRAIASDSEQNIIVADTTLEELNFVHGVNAPIQGQINNLAGIGNPPQVEDFIASGVWTKPAGMTYVIVEVVSGGGGGVGSTSAGGGGGGGYARVKIRADDLAATVSVTVGAGGTQAVDGGASSFGSIVVPGGKGAVNANGGDAGGYGGPIGGQNTAGTPVSLNGVFGGAGGDYGAPGGNSDYGPGGGDGRNVNGVGGIGSGLKVPGYLICGNGGAGNTSTVTPGGDGQIPGGGGAAGYTAAAGSTAHAGNGARGQVRVTTYFYN
jgi:hypothetical protein